MNVFELIKTKADFSRIFFSLARGGMATKAFTKFLPLFDRVLVQRFEAATKSKGGIIIPDKAKEKVLKATVVAAGPGRVSEDGKCIPICVKVGDNVLLPEYGGTKVVYDDKDYFIFRESDILGKITE